MPHGTVAAGGAMSAQTIYELIGYLGSALIVVSLAMSSVIKLRIVNLAGALVFTLYGALIGSVPVVATNIVITGIDIWFLGKEYRTREQFTVIEVEAGDPFLASFIEYHRGDIATYVPDIHRLEGDLRFVMLRDTAMVGVFIGVSQPGRVMHIVLDYVAIPWRDLKSGASLYRDDGLRFANRGYTAIEVSDVDHRQADYFAHMGFVPEGNGMVKHVRRT